MLTQLRLKALMHYAEIRSDTPAASRLSNNLDTGDFFPF